MADPGAGAVATEAPPAGPRPDRRTIQAERRKAQRRTRRRWPKVLLICAVVVVLLAVAAGVGAFYLYPAYRYHQIRKVDVPHLVRPSAPPGQPENILLVGSDTRAFVSNPTQENAFGSSTVEGGQRSDVIIVARIVPATHQVYLLSIPRDLWVDIPGDSSVSGYAKINAAYNEGPDLLIQTIEKDLSIPINHYVEVDFPGFQGMVDALGGVTMDFPDQVRDSYSGLNVTTTGCQVVNGATALELVRARHLEYQADGEWQDDGLGDLSRIRRQDAFFRAVLAKLAAEDLNPLAINGFIGAAVKNMTIDSKLTEGDLESLARQFHGITGSSLHTETLPTTAYDAPDGESALEAAQPFADNTVFGFNLQGTTPPPTTTTTTTTAPSLPPSAVTVTVLNGDGVAGTAHATAASLQSAGFQVGTVGDASSDTTGTTEIDYGPKSKAAAQVLAAHLEGTTRLVAVHDLGPDQVTLVIGSSLQGVAGATGSGTTTSTSSTTTTIPGDVYTNDQPEPWNPTPCTLG